MKLLVVAEVWTGSALTLRRDRGSSGSHVEPCLKALHSLGWATELLHNPTIGTSQWQFTRTGADMFRTSIRLHRPKRLLLPKNIAKLDTLDTFQLLLLLENRGWAHHEWGVTSNEPYTYV